MSTATRDRLCARLEIPGAAPGVRICISTLEPERAERVADDLPEVLRQAARGAAP